MTFERGTDLLNSHWGTTGVTGTPGQQSERHRGDSFCSRWRWTPRPPSPREGWLLCKGVS